MAIPGGILLLLTVTGYLPLKIVARLKERFDRKHPNGVRIEKNLDPVDAYRRADLRLPAINHYNPRLIFCERWWQLSKKILSFPWKSERAVIITLASLLLGWVFYWVGANVLSFYPVHIRIIEVQWVCTGEIYNQSGEVGHPIKGSKVQHDGRDNTPTCPTVNDSPIQIREGETFKTDRTLSVTFEIIKGDEHISAGIKETKELPVNSPWFELLTPGSEWKTHVNKELFFSSYNDFEKEYRSEESR